MKENKTLDNEIKNESENLEKVEETKNEIKVETTVEAPADDIAPIDMSKVNLYEIDKNVNSETFEADVESKRASIQAAYKKQKNMSNIMTMCMVALVIVSIILISQKGDALKYTGYAVGGVSLVGMLIYYAVNRNKMPNLMSDYMKSVQALFNGFLYKDNRYGKVSSNYEEKVDMGEIASDRVYANIKGCGSRNLIRGSFLDNPFWIADVKCITLEKNKEADLFVGKYLSCQNGYKFDGRVILNICLKGAKTYDLPTDISDLNAVEQKDQMTIWATPGLDYKKVLTNDIINKLNHLNVNEEKHLYNVNIVVWGGHTGVYLSYDNSVMSFPFEEEFKKQGLEHFKADQAIIFDIFEMMNKAKVIKHNKALEEKVEEPVEEEAKAEEPVVAPIEEVKAEEPVKEVKVEETVAEPAPVEEVKVEEAATEAKATVAKKAPAKKSTTTKKTTTAKKTTTTKKSTTGTKKTTTSKKAVKKD